MRIILVSLILAFACSSESRLKRKEKIESWDSGAQATKSFQDEGVSERDETVRDQINNPGSSSTTQNPL